MKNIKRYKDFIKEELSADMPPKVPTEIHSKYEAPISKYSAEDTYVFNPSIKKDDDTLHRTTRSKSEMEKMTKYQHWTLDSTHVDTLFEIVRKDPKTEFFADTLDFNVSGDLFLTGKFNLGTDVVDSILESINEINAKDGIITDFQIESSTDAEPIDMEYGGKSGNDALAQKRGDVVKGELIKIGVDPSIISIEPLKEQGPHLYTDDMTEDERDDARIATKDFRYVKVRIIYTIIGDTTLPAEIDTIVKTKKEYYLSKSISGKGGGNPPRLRKHFKKTTIKIPELELSRDNGRTKCARWGKKRKGFWTHKKLGYE
jgi:hypothetical protein